MHFWGTALGNISSCRVVLQCKFDPHKKKHENWGAGKSPAKVNQLKNLHIFFNAFSNEPMSHLSL